MNWTWPAPRAREVPEVLSGGYGEDVDSVVRLCGAIIEVRDCQLDCLVSQPA